jgi:hypothetical protein
MSYQESLEAAGAVVHAFQNFGSYQGEWFAKVTYNDETGWINGNFGSCSGCDAFEAEFGWGKGDRCDDHEHDYTEEYKTCSKCKESESVFKAKLADFGKTYLDGLMTQEQAEKQASQHIEWDIDAQEMLKFVQDNKL